MFCAAGPKERAEGVRAFARLSHVQGRLEASIEDWGDSPSSWKSWALGSEGVPPMSSLNLHEMQQSCSYNSRSWCIQCILSIQHTYFFKWYQRVTSVSLAVWSIYTTPEVSISILIKSFSGHGAVPETWALCAQCRVAWQFCWSILSLYATCWRRFPGYLHWAPCSVLYQTHWFTTRDESWWFFKLKLQTDVARLGDA